MTWIVYHVVKDKRCMEGTRWQAIGWINNDNEQLAEVEAKKVFNGFGTLEIKLVKTEQGYGWLM